MVMRIGYWMTRGLLVARVETYVAEAVNKRWQGRGMFGNFCWTDEGFCRYDGVEDDGDLIEFISPEMPYQEYKRFYNNLVEDAKRNKVPMQILREHRLCKALLTLATCTEEQCARLGVEKYRPAIDVFSNQILNLSDPQVDLRWKKGMAIRTGEKSLLYKLLAGTPDQQSAVIEVKNLHLLMELVECATSGKPRK